MPRNADKTECIHGHPFNDRNTRITSASMIHMLGAVEQRALARAMAVERLAV
jgi:hypothetical protein